MRQFDRRLAYHFDWLLLVLTLLIIGGGLATIFSASEARVHTGFVHNPLVMRQALYAGVGLLGMGAIVLLDYRRLERYAYVVYAATLLLVLVVPFVGSVGGGARRWINLGPISIQPSEMIKVSLVIALARYFHRSRATGDVRFIDVIPAFVLLAVPSALILAQPDLGTVGILAIVAFSVLFCAGLRIRVFVMLAAVAALAVPLLWGHLKPYQQQRVQTFLSPEMDPLGAGYHVIQSKIAIGSGELWGKGFLRGTQNKLNFIPEQHTDFIFSVFAEEWGFAGAFVLLGLYAALVLRGLMVAYRAKDRFGALLTFGVVAIVFWQVVINVGMTSGILPVVGITLPFFSYGGSSLTTMMVAVGLMINVNMRRFLF
ncbi:MAG: rod shape-determining protein RodA [Polyangiaceae bacterium UTPRO1]|jgi:rod shape determining protein RodA|nr:rod shape-determining protein RodA [Myxococcales bacterium]OQY65804.1 MAG: rod shape-determining protein RodA [Polyangiaceae bacterium UTPRO1]